MSDNSTPPQVELCITRSSFNAIRQHPTVLWLTNDEAEALGTVVAESEILLREHLEGFATGRWLITKVGAISPPSDLGTSLALAHPPIALNDGAAQATTNLPPGAGVGP